MIARTVRTALAALFLSYAAAFGATAKDTTTTFYAHLQDRDFATAATLFDPASLTEFRQSLEVIDDAPPTAQQQFREAFFGDGATAESVAKLSDAEFFSSFLRAAVEQTEAFGKVDFDRIDILGEVPEDPDLAHVVVRNRVVVGDSEVEGMEVVTCRKRGDEWKLLPSTEMQGLANQIRAALAQVPK